MPLPNQGYGFRAQTPGCTLQGAAQTANDNHIDVKSDIRLTNMSNLSLTYTRTVRDLTTPRIFLNNSNDQAYHGFTERGTASYVVGGSWWTSETRFGYSLNDMDRTDAYLLQSVPETLPFRRQPSHSCPMRVFLPREPSYGWRKAGPGAWRKSTRGVVGKHSLRIRRHLHAL